MPMIMPKLSFVFMFLLTVPIVKNSHIGCNLLYLSKKRPGPLLKSLSIQNLDLSEKIGKVVIK